MGDLSDEERETAKTLRDTLDEFNCLPEIPRAVALLDRLISAPRLSAEDRATAEAFVAWAVDDLESADDPQWAAHQAGAAVVRRMLGVKP